MKLKLKLVGLLVLTFLLLLGGNTATQAQDATTYLFVVPSAPATANIVHSKMVKLGKNWLAGKEAPVDRGPLVTQLDYRDEMTFDPGDVIYKNRGGAGLWGGTIVDPKTKDSFLKQFRNQRGNGIGVLSIIQGDGSYPLSASNFVARAQIFTEGNTNLYIKPTRFLFIGYIYQRVQSGPDAGWVITDAEGNYPRPNKYQYNSLKSLNRSKKKFDTMIIVAQYPDVGINASIVPASSAEQQVAVAADEVLDKRSDIFFLTAFVEGWNETPDGEGVVEFDGANSYIFVFPYDDENTILAPQ